MPYREERHLQGIHMLAARRAGGGRTVPLLVTPAGDALADAMAREVRRLRDHAAGRYALRLYDTER